LLCFLLLIFLVAARPRCEGIEQKTTAFLDNSWLYYPQKFCNKLKSVLIYKDGSKKKYNKQDGKFAIEFEFAFLYLTFQSHDVCLCSKFLG